MPIPDDQYTPAPSPTQAIAIESLGHRVQSAIAFFQGRQEAFGERFAEIEPKHLRVGVSSALIETSALARLMLSKKLITANEYFDMLITVWEEEVASYQRSIDMLFADTGTRVKI